MTLSPNAFRVLVKLTWGSGITTGVLVFLSLIVGKLAFHLAGASLVITILLFAGVIGQVFGSDPADADDGDAYDGNREG